MSIIVQRIEPKKEEDYYLFIKGADDAIIKKVEDKDKKILIEEKTFDLASIGLRTLCFAYK